MEIKLDQEQYEALIALAQKSTLDPDGTVNSVRALVLDTFLKDVEKKNGITRYFLYIQWQDPLAPLPPGVKFPESWPPELRYPLTLISRPISRTDVLAVVKQRTTKALNILVTKDPAGLIGWQKLDDHFLQP